MTGLALSGGGIRSSTLNLGIVQVLHRIGLFKCLDYLSTVSGGGYLGSSISANYTFASEPASAQVEEDDLLAGVQQRFPYQHVQGKPESSAFLQLRNYSSFLVPRGFIDYMKFPVLLIRGILLNFLFILPWIIGAALVTGETLLASEGHWPWYGFAGLPPPLANFSITLALLALLLLLMILFPISRWFQVLTEGGERIRVFRRFYESTMVVVLVLVVVAAWVELQPVAIEYLRRWGMRLDLLTAATGSGSALLATLTHLFAKQLKSLVSRFALYLIALAGFVAFWLLYLMCSVWLLETPLWWPGGEGLPVVVVLGALLVLLTIYSAWFANANGLSLHNFYRDRLEKAFLFRVEDSRVRNALDLKLSQLSKRLGPLHLINAAINTRKLPERFRKGRHSDVFFFSREYSGSRITGYIPTPELEKAQRDLSVAAAMATSGAAVSSNMGAKSNPALRLILSMLNIRLGYWLINPFYYDHEQSRLRYPLGRLLGVGLIRFLQELTGWLDYKTSFVYLSDGGHIENMGIYPLIQRQCRLIIVGDGECDPGYTFQGLLDALRMIRVDFGVQIDMDGLDEIRSGEQQYALGTIHYPDKRIGYLIYLKSSLLGDDMIEATVSSNAYVSSPLRSDVRRYDELGYIAHYKATHPDFPHETTADQFFDEAQFECYRSLGYLIADRAFTGR